MTRPGSHRHHDVVLYGASGFVGRQTVAYFMQHAPALRWALAGRSRDKLEAVRHACGADGAGVIVADAADAAALDQLAAHTRVVLSTAGPFALYGSELVAACARHGTHYVDITGETPWVRRMIDRHHDEAVQRCARIVPGCGFDSVPSDLGAWFVAQALWQRHGERCRSVKACYSMRGGLNGGTLASALNLIESGDRAQMQDPFLLNPFGTAPAIIAPHADPIAPHRDADFDAWVGPFVMGPVNTRVVRRSAALTGREPYAPDFAYQEYMRFGRGATAALAAAATSAASLAAMGALAFAPARRAAAALAPSPGEGPSALIMDGGHFRCELVGTGERGTVVRARIVTQGDPGNRATTQFVCESALALVLDLAVLPGGARHGGVLTPATAFGDVLVNRLRAAGTTIELV
jgi:short subunit dehydrogenase-like uncharacterized protein